MEFKMTVNMDNAAFDRGDGRELARILREVADRLADVQEGSGSVRDVNGNKVGEYEITEDK